jgi:hypothetical protein
VRLQQTILNWVGMAFFSVLLCSHANLSALSMHNLGVSYGDVGRLDDALALLKQTLDFRRRVQPENHPEIGSMRS